MTKSESIAELAKALVKAQSFMKPAAKDATNPFFKSKYADFQSIWESLRIPLTTNGLAVVQTTSVKDQMTILHTLLIHSSGEWISGEFPIHPTKPDPQALGSAMTYAKRYALAAICGVVTGDDDGEAAMDRTPIDRTPPGAITLPKYSKPLPQVTRTQNAVKPVAKEGFVIHK